MARLPKSKQSGTILVVDDHDVVRYGLSQVLRRTFETAQVVEAEQFPEALERLADPAVFLVIIDLGIPGLGSPRELSKLRRLRPDVHVIVLSGSDARSDILAALEAGAHGYIVKTDRTEKVIEHIKHVLAGEIYVPPVLAELKTDAAVKPIVPGIATASLDVLTKRQREVLVLISEGLSNKEIGRRLEVAEGTVKMHVATIFRAIGATNRAHAAAIGKKYLGDSSTT